VLLAVIPRPEDIWDPGMVSAKGILCGMVLAGVLVVGLLVFLTVSVPNSCAQSERRPRSQRGRGKEGIRESRRR